MQQQQKSSNNATRKELLVFIATLVIMTLLYGSPRLIEKGGSLHYLKVLGIDCAFMAIASWPVWWIHFRKLHHWSLRKRFLLHIATGLFPYYAIWVLLYQWYNPLIGLPLMTTKQIIQNLGPNLLWYFQVFGILHIYHFFRERETQLIREKELRELAYQGEINALKAQIQPHFLFNTLNSISASLPPEQEQARMLIARLADTFRYALLSTREELVPLSDELNFMRTYLALEQARFGKRLRFSVDADGSIARVRIPPMLLQPLVENAVKHGIEPAINGGAVSVTCRQQGAKVHIAICNTGRPFSGTVDQLFHSKGVGLVNMARRLERHYNEKLAVSDNGSGLCFEFCIPA
ncbi:MAG: histidine kinase [Niabella sp.]|nr:histidine kinase [Niabella sp.]